MEEPLRAADDFATIRVRIEELKREREAEAEQSKRSGEEERLDERRWRVRHPRRNWRPV